jgi:signal transduction histidine kinase
MKVYLFLFFSLMFNFSIHSLDSILINDKTAKLSIDSYIEFYEDKTGNLTINDISKEKFSFNNSKKIFNKGYSKSAFWIRFEINNKTKEKDKIFLEIKYPYLESLELYYQDDEGNYSKKNNGYRVPFNNREIKNKNYTFSLPIRPDENIFYLKIKNSLYTFAPLTIYSSMALLENENVENFFYGIYYGIMLIILIINILILFVYFEKSFVYYIFFFASVILLQTTFNNIASQYLFPNSKIFNNSLVIQISNFCCIFTTLFSKNFLEIKKYSRHLDNILNIYIFLIPFDSLLFFIDKTLSTKLMGFLNIFTSILLVLISIVFFIKKSRYSIYFMLACFLYFFGAITINLHAAGIQLEYFINFSAFQYGSIFLVIMLPIAFVDKFSTLKKEKEIADKAIAEKEKDEFASMGILLGGISHEILNPLSGITGPLDNLKKHLTLNLKLNDEKINKYVEYIEKNSLRIDSIIKNLNALYKKQEMLKEKIDMPELVKTIFENYKTNQNKKIDFISELNRQIEVYADKNAIHQILNNLVSNAIESIKDKGKIIISLEKIENQKELKVIDTGSGIESREIKNIFNAFYTTKTIENNIGLGLYIVKDLIIKMGWEINVDSSKEAGTTFKIILQE